MSRRHARTPSSVARPPSAAAAPTPREEAPSASDDLAFRLSVERMLAQRASFRTAGRYDLLAAPAVAPAPAEEAERAAEPERAEEVGIRAPERPARRGEARHERAAAARAATDAPPIVTTVPVRGMTCRSCEVRIQRHVGRLKNVQRVTASAVHGRVVIESTRPIPEAAIERAIETAGYEIGHTPWLERDPAVWLTAGAGLMLVIILAFIAQVTGLAGIASGAGDLARGGLVVALLLGLAAGVSTCMALVGGLVLALSAAFQARGAATGTSDESAAGRMRPALVFIGGRIVGYGVLGAALGAVGASVALPPQVTAVLMIAVAIAMTLLGTRLTGLSPRLAGWSPTLPMGLGRRLGLGDGTVSAYSDTRAATLGAASFFLPCGFTQAVQIYALSTGSPLFGGALLATFAIGTAPGLLALAGVPVFVPSGARPTLLRLVGVVVLGFAVVNASSALRLSGLSFDLPGVTTVAAAAAPAAKGISADGTQSLTTFEDVNGYSPGNVSIYAGIPTRWTVISRSTATCAASLVVPSLDISKRLRVGSNTIDLPALPPGTIRYSCAMGMYGGLITVVNRPSGSAGS